MKNISEPQNEIETSAKFTIMFRLLIPVFIWPQHDWNKEQEILLSDTCWPVAEGDLFPHP